jgi:hypothetical protein
VSVARFDDGTIALSGACEVEDAQTLLEMLIATPGAPVDWRDCEHAHAAVIQVLLAAGIEPRGPPRSDVLRDIVEPAIKAR